MSALKPSFSVHVDEARGEFYFKTSGLFDAQSMQAFLDHLSAKVGPMIRQKRKVRALGDLTDYVVQTREIGDKMAEILRNGEHAGVERTAIIMTSALLKMQYQRASEGRNVKIFEDKNEALHWLRAD